MSSGNLGSLDTLDGTQRDSYLAQFEAWLVDAVSQGARDELIVSLTDLVAKLVDAALQARLELKQERAAHAGRRTERIDAAQLSMMLALLGEAGTDDPDGRIAALEKALGESEQEAAAAEATEREKKRQSASGGAKRKPLPPELPREVEEHRLAADQLACECCGHDLVHIGNDTSETLAIVPARFVVKRHVVAKYACGRCKSSIRTAPRPPKPVPGGIADASLLAHIVCSKYLDHMPLQRLRSRYGRDGVDIPISTLADQVAFTAELLQPIFDRIRERVLASHVIQTDASGLKVLDPSDPNGIRRGTMWCYVGDRRWVYFDYRETGSGEDGPWSVLAGRQGYIQADAANTFDRLFNGRAADATEVGCWAHARRKLFKLKDSDHRVAWPLKLIAMLYRIENIATRDDLAPAQRSELRQRDARDVLDQLFAWYTRTAAREPPTSALGKACRYALNHRQALECYLEDGQLRPDNNFCELQIRSLAVGRKNYLFAGSDAGAERAAVMYTLVRTAVLHGLDPQAYLTDVLNRLAVPRKASDIDELLPDVWAEAHRDELVLDADAA